MHNYAPCPAALQVEEAEDIVANSRHMSMDTTAEQSRVGSGDEDSDDEQPRGALAGLGGLFGRSLFERGQVDAFRLTGMPDVGSVHSVRLRMDGSMAFLPGKEWHIAQVAVAKVRVS